MKYSLRSLFVVVTLVCVVLGRIAYLRHMAAFHLHEAMRYAEILDSKSESEGDVRQPLWDAMTSHAVISNRYREASFRPWTMVKHGEIADPVPATNPAKD
jgi:hypothetical protein